MELAGAEFVNSSFQAAYIVFTRLIRQPENRLRRPNTIFRLPFAKRKNTRYIPPRKN